MNFCQIDEPSSHVEMHIDTMMAHFQTFQRKSREKFEALEKLAKDIPKVIIVLSTCMFDVFVAAIKFASLFCC